MHAQFYFAKLALPDSLEQRIITHGGNLAPARPRANNWWYRIFAHFTFARCIIDRHLLVREWSLSWNIKTAGKILCVWSSLNGKMKFVIRPFFNYPRLSDRELPKKFLSQSILLFARDTPLITSRNKKKWIIPTLYIVFPKPFESFTEYCSLPEWRWTVYKLRWSAELPNCITHLLAWF